MARVLPKDAYECAVMTIGGLASGAPVPGGRPNAEPGGGRASGAAQRCRLDLNTAEFGSAAR
jgi:hypothetical protein